MRSIFSLLAFFAVAAWAHAQHNVVLIIADDLGTDYLGFYEDHQDTADMPNLRRLQASGVRFTNAMSNPICSPTRATVLTGRYSFRTGVGDAVAGTGTTTLSLAEKTIPLLLEVFNPNIAKANIGKWHLHNPMPISNLNIPNQLGYDHFSGPFIGELPNYYNWTKVTNGASSNVTTYATTETVNDAIAWTSAQTQPFFLWLAFNAPHTPFHLPPAGLHSYTNLSGTQQDINQNPEAYYKASLEALDHEIGRLLDVLEASGKLADTDIIFLGDNGDPKQVSQNGMSSRAKGTIYQNGVKVPLFVSGPSVVQPGRVSDALVNTVDLFATVLELFGDVNWAWQIPADKPVDSQSLLPILQNQCGAGRAWAFAEIFKNTPDANDGKAIRNRSYKLLQFDDGHEEFYHLDTDPNETNDLLNAAMGVAAQANYNYLSNVMTETVNATNPAISAWLRNVTGLKGRHYVQGNPTPIQDNVLANVQSVQYSNNWVYVDATGIPAYITGPFLDGNPSLATEQTGYFKFPLNPVQNTGTPTATTPGNIGAFINGVALFDYRDGVAWNTNTNSLCGGPGNPPCPGGMGTPQVWNRDAVLAERGGFDCAKAHPAMGNYHHHQNPSAFNLDDVVVSNVCDLYPADGLYVIDETQHSPLIGFAYDGFPIYGAYAHKNADGTGGIVRMKSGYHLRNITVRTHYADGTNVADGPPVSQTYPLGYFREDYEFIASTEPDVLDVHNGRFCVTPEYPNGIYCYFATVDQNLNSAYPYAVGPTFYGVKSASKVTNIGESVTTYQGEPLAATTTVCNVNCFGTATGEITLFVNGGNQPYTFNWGNGITTQNRSGLVAGNYTVTITDAIGQTTTQSATVTQPSSGVSVVSSAGAVACFGEATGNIELTTTGGMVGYTYSWQDGHTSEDRTGLAAGTYAVTITDGSGCTATASATVSQPAAALLANAAATQVACFGEATGNIQLDATGGTAGYAYLWQDGNTSEDRTGLAAGSYTVTTTDANGCTTTASATVSQPSSALVVDAAATQVACFGEATGSIQLTTTGGTAGYTYLWQDGGTSEGNTGLEAGIYSVTATDANGCTTTTAVTVAQPASALVVDAAATPVACFGEATGSIQLSVSGGTAGYAYLWQDGSTLDGRTGLVAGSYGITTTDANGCTATAVANIGEPMQITANLTATNATCGEENGTVSLSVNGGTGPYTLLWSNGSTAMDLSDLPTGAYTVIITDQNNCTANAGATVSNQSGATVSLTTVPIACQGQATGGIDLEISSGTAPFTFLWNDGDTQQNRAGLLAGNYTVSITDGLGCQTILSELLEEPAALALSGLAIAEACGQGNGSVSLTVTGGTMPYAYFWNNGMTTDNLTGLAAGEYSVVVTDANNCTNSITAIVGTVVGATVTPTVTEVACFGEMTGEIALAVENGTAPLGYLWSNGATTQNLNGVGAGEYTATITDANGCSTTVSQTVGQPAFGLSALPYGAGVTCFGEANGTVGVSVNGGTAGYSFLWDNGGTVQEQVGLFGGNYSVTITDANGCTTEASQTVGEPEALEAAASPTAIGCFGEATGTIELVINGGTSPYDFVWSNGQTTQDLSDVAAGSFTVSITDANGCTTSASASISQPASALSVATSSTPATAVNDGTATATGSGGTPPYVYQWGNGANGSFLENLPAGVYTVTTTDANGCTTENDVTVDFLISTESPFGASSLVIFPNPAPDFIAVQVKGLVKNELSVQMTSLDGKLIKENTIYRGSTMCYFDVSTLYEGAYLITVTDGQLRQTVKVVVAH